MPIRGLQMTVGRQGRFCMPIIPFLDIEPGTSQVLDQVLSQIPKQTTTITTKTQAEELM